MEVIVYRLKSRTRHLTVGRSNSQSSDTFGRYSYTICIHILIHPGSAHLVLLKFSRIKTCCNYIAWSSAVNTDTKGQTYMDIQVMLNYDSTFALLNLLILSIEKDVRTR